MLVVRVATRLLPWAGLPWAPAKPAPLARPSATSGAGAIGTPLRALIRCSDLLAGSVSANNVVTLSRLSWAITAAKAWGRRALLLLSESTTGNSRRP